MPNMNMYKYSGFDKSSCPFIIDSLNKLSKKSQKPKRDKSPKSIIKKKTNSVVDISPLLKFMPYNVSIFYIKNVGMKFKIINCYILIDKSSFIYKMTSSDRNVFIGNYISYIIYNSCEFIKFNGKKYDSLFSIESMHDNRSTIEFIKTSCRVKISVNILEFISCYYSTSQKDLCSNKSVLSLFQYICNKQSTLTTK